MGLMLGICTILIRERGTLRSLSFFAIYIMTVKETFYMKLIIPDKLKEIFWWAVVIGSFIYTISPITIVLLLACITNGVLYYFIVERGKTTPIIIDECIPKQRAIKVVYRRYKNRKFIHRRC